MTTIVGDHGPPDASAALEGFLKGLAHRLGLGENNSGLRVRSVLSYRGRGGQAMEAG